MRAADSRANLAAQPLPQVLVVPYLLSSSRRVEGVTAEDLAVAVADVQRRLPGIRWAGGGGRVPPMGAPAPLQGP